MLLSKLSTSKWNLGGDNLLTFCGRFQPYEVVWSIVLMTVLIFVEEQRRIWEKGCKYLSKMGQFIWEEIYNYHSKYGMERIELSQTCIKWPLEVGDYSGHLR